jgi:hypothetical protein
VTADLLRRYSPPPGLSRSAPRDVRLTGGGRALVVLAWLLAIAAIPAGVLLSREARRQSDAAQAFQQRGAIATAVVDRVWRKSGDGKPALAAFHFDAGGVRIQGETRMQLSVWRELRAGSTVPVRYLPEDPRRWVVEGSRAGGRLPLWVVFFVPGLLTVLGVACLAAIRRQRSLLMDGRAAPAIVTEIKKHHGKDGATHREIVYQFPLLSGGVGSGKASAPKTAAVGATICVIYDPDRPKRNHPYPFSLVAADAGER